MANIDTVEVSAAARLEQRSIRVVFFVAGCAMSAWAPLVPFVKARAALDERGLGLLLLCLGVGSIVMMPVAGALAARFGCRVVITVSGAFVCVALPLLALVSSVPLLAAALLLFGASIGAIDVAMNIQAIIVERASGKAMMSGFHALYSFGGIAGAAVLSGLLGLGASPPVGTALVTTGIVVALAVAAPHLLPYGNKSDGPAFAFPRGVVLFIGGLCFIAFMAEGAVLDWGAVFLTSVLDLAPSYGGLGYAAFSVTMTLGRFTGDRIVQRFGGTRAIIWGGICAATGFCVVTVASALPVALIGYALVGVGSANIVPVLFTAVGRQTTMAEAVAVPAITTLGYLGILIGPALIGFVAHAAGLSTAFLIVAALLLVVAASGRFLRLR
jgi:predicted MFS family arabinose efflux permease